MEPPKIFLASLVVNGLSIEQIMIGRHYREKHPYMNDDLILTLVQTLDGGVFPVDSVTGVTEYYAADVRHEETQKIYRLIWLFDGARLEILGVIHAYRRRTKKKGEAK